MAYYIWVVTAKTRLRHIESYYHSTKLYSIKQLKYIHFDLVKLIDLWACLANIVIQVTVNKAN